ncbi:hypothetical protein B1A67_00600 [Clostridium botulinum D/C]|uniref:GLUG motif-containing protein n=1 Tax=Clostridium botulinum TaxID=1491 RepID=UPI000992ED2D|nr:ZmpA/ZmpB/ZmpC family metallo-endopeptidase-related protein [Clostridium botulinum]OOV53063.1 hypothetical protein B1A66_00555 [Clostridium botulinum D/C]OOV58369.1 hypothetical protein B0673_02715 [Clostridium botulinum D/C]OOV59568.1 hypothetical protein B1A67_00600 [Clostridium botulinum D/C]
MANGKFAGGDGSVSNPYLIEDAFDLDKVRDNLNASYKLTNDIDLNVKPFNEGEGWKPIGAYITNGFKGNFDGNEHCIKNLRKYGSYNGGIFSAITDSNIKNLGIIDVNITEGFQSSPLAGECKNSNVTNCFASGVIDVEDIKCGGLLGELITGNILNCFSSCNVKGKECVGGLIGYIYQQNFTIKNCYSTGKVASTQNESYGGLIGRNNYHKYDAIINSYWDIATSGQTSSAGGEGKTTEQMKKPSTFKDWEDEKLEDGTPVWILKEGEYPKLYRRELKFLLKENKTENLFSFEDDVIVDLGKQQVIEQLYKEKGFDDVLDLNKTYKKKKMFFIEKENTNEGSISKINITDNILKILRIKI